MVCSLEFHVKKLFLKHGNNIIHFYCQYIILLVCYVKMECCVSACLSSSWQVSKVRVMQ